MYLASNEYSTLFPPDIVYNNWCCTGEDEHPLSLLQLDFPEDDLRPTNELIAIPRESWDVVCQISFCDFVLHTVIAIANNR